jgi:hypothetical protein
MTTEKYYIDQNTIKEANVLSASIKKGIINTPVIISFLSKIEKLETAPKKKSKQIDVMAEQLNKLTKGKWIVKQ